MTSPASNGGSSASMSLAYLSAQLPGRASPCSRSSPVIASRCSRSSLVIARPYPPGPSFGAGPFLCPEDCMTDTTDLYWNPDWDEDEAAEIDEQDPDPTLGL